MLYCWLGIYPRVFSGSFSESPANEKREAQAPLVDHSQSHWIYEKAIPARIKTANPAAGITHVFFLTNSDIYYLRYGAVHVGLLQSRISAIDINAQNGLSTWS